MRTRIVTFLGLGSESPPHYTPCRYQFDGEEPTPKTPNHDVAAVRHFGGPCSVVVLGTQEVQGRWLGESNLYETSLREGIVGSDRINDVQLGFRLLPSGRTVEERWQMFSTVVDSLSDKAIDLEWPHGTTQREPEAPTQVVLDITHGFRLQPFFAASAIAFVQSQRRRLAEKGRSIRILYAAFDPKSAKEQESYVAPMWELTQLIDVLEWDAAIDGLMRYGRADDLQKLVAQEQKRANDPASKAYPKLKAFGDAARKFADGLVTARMPQTMTELSSGLVRAIDACRDDLRHHVPPVEGQLDRLRGWANELSASKAVGPEGVRAGLALTRRYLELERFAEAAVALRETLVTAHTWNLHHRAALQPGRGGANDVNGDEGFAAQREQDEKDLGDPKKRPTRRDASCFAASATCETT